jgi:hypothetical protein
MKHGKIQSMPQCGNDEGGKVESTSEFLRVLQHEKSLSTAHRPLRLRLAQAGQLAEDVLLPQRVTGSESVCGGIEYRIACLAGSPALPLKELIALPAELQFVTDRGQLRSVCGIVTEARAGDADGGLAVYELVLRDVFAVMEKRTNSRIFRYMSELDIVQTLCDEWRHANTVLAGAFELEIDPLLDMRKYPTRPLCGACSSGAAWPGYSGPDAATGPRSTRCTTARLRIRWCCSTTPTTCRRTAPAACATTATAWPADATRSRPGPPRAACSRASPRATAGTTRTRPARSS